MCVTGYNKKSEFYLNSLNKLEYCNRLEYRSFLIFSLIMDQSFCTSESTYEKQCTQLNNPSKWNVFNYTNKWDQVEFFKSTIRNHHFNLRVIGFL